MLLPDVVASPVPDWLRALRSESDGPPLRPRVPLIAGALWDASGWAALAFVPGVLAAAAMAWLTLPLRIPSEPGGSPKAGP